jgi:radical SAM protein with 4Fe4S-binding SPASM domain
MASYLEALYAKATRKAHPSFAMLELTYQCNFSCRHCYNPIARKNQARKNGPPKPPAKPLSFEEIVSVLDQLREMGVLYVSLTGGEPLLHPRFFDILEAAKERSFAVRIFTNGALITPAIADRLSEIGPHCLEISIHGASDATAEALNQVKGSHQALLRTLGYLKERGLRVYLKCTVTKLNEGELSDIKAIGGTFGFPVFFDPVITLSDDGEEYPLEMRASDEGVAKLYKSDGLNVGNSPFDWEPGDLSCTVGAGTIHITPYGDIQPCIQWKQSVGNIREKPLKEIWTTSPILEEARRVAREMPALIKQGTKDHAFCRHCPGLSLLRYGDPRKLEEQYLRMARIKAEIAREEANTFSPGGKNNAFPPGEKGGLDTA